ncbi:hypothetical protein D9M68_522000 [compost metagenome]
MLNTEASNPGARSYVLKLHRDVSADGEIFGRLENLVSGRQFDFSTGQEMLDFLLAEVKKPAVRFARHRVLPAIVGVTDATAAMCAGWKNVRCSTSGSSSPLRCVA